jgi:DNA-binding NtrC family response regulator
MPALIVLVNTDREVLKGTEVNLTRAGLAVAAVSSFAEARTLLRRAEPDGLVADLRLGAFNGLHLAIESSVRRPGMPVFITYSRPDPCMEREAVKYGARFVVAPADNPDFADEVRAVIETAASDEREHRLRLSV